MSSPRPHPLVRARPRPIFVQFPSDTKTESVSSDDPAPATSGILNANGTKIPRFDLEKTFPAILAPLSLLRKIPESENIDALRALAPVFANCIDEILHSMARLPGLVLAGQKYHIARSGVHFSKDLFVGHVDHIQEYAQPSSRREAIHIAMQLLDMTMASLKGFLNAAAYEVAQSKPLPQIPVQDNLDTVTDESEASTPVLPSPVDSDQLGSNATSSPSNSTDALDQPQKSKVSALLKPIRDRMKRKPSRMDLSAMGSSASTTVVNTDSGDLNCGYVHVTVNIRESLAQFPVSINPFVANIPHPDDVAELWKDRNGLAQLASLNALVRYITSPDGDNDVEIIDVFFLCFRFFSSPQETLDALVTRYNEVLLCGSGSVARSHSVQVQVRIAKLMYLWVELHWRAEDTEVLGSLSQFVFSRLSQDIPHDASSKLVLSLLERACAGDKSKGLRKEKTIARAESKYRQDMLRSTWEPREKKSMMKNDFSRVKLQHFNSSGGHNMLALQLTLLLWEKYRAFEPEDAVRYLMTKDGDDSPPTTEVGRKVMNFMAYERALHRFVMNSIGTAESVQMRIELVELFLELAIKCHELRNYSASCLIVLACDRPTVLPFITKLKLSPAHEQMKIKLMDFYTRENRHMAGYKQALQSCSCPALPGMVLFIREVARGCGSGPYDQHPSFPGSRLINLKRYRPITWAVRAMERCHAPFKIQRVDYICDWLEHVLSEYLEGTEVEWENRIHDNCRRL